MSGFDKIIKGACKPKAAPPKSKASGHLGYVEPIIAATWSEDGAVGDVCKALSPKFKEPNAVVVYKALIVLHMMIRNGATDNVLSYLSNTDVLRLKNVGGGHWEGYNTPQNLQHYAIYLDTRIRAYREMKHDAIRVQSETNRDHRLSTAIEDDNLARGRNIDRYRDQGGLSSASVQRSKTMAGRKLRIMSVEKGLLRETRAVQKQIDALVECRFYLENLEDELTITSLRMLVKDLVILFQAGNEGMVNVLEHFFEMSHVDAERALALYRHFCKQTERVVEYLGVARKLQNLLNVPIPNMKHATGALEEYLTDPNFEQNRIEYKAQKEAADRNAKAGNKGLVPKTEDKASTSNPSSSVTPSSSNETVKPDNKQAVIDFFSAIEEEQQTMFNPQTGSPTSAYFQQQAAHNPFQMQMQQMTGAFPSQPFGQPAQPFGQSGQSQMQMQPTGFAQPQHVAFQMPLTTGTNPFGMGIQNQQQQQQQQSFLRPQTTGFLQPQSTGANPFRQSILMPQNTGMPQFPMNTGAGMPNFMNTNAPSPNAFQQQQSSPFPATPISVASSSSSAMSSTFSTTPSFATPTAQQPNLNGIDKSSLPARPATAPLSQQQTSTTPQLVKSHQTGSKNPFGVPVMPAPPVPQPPTLMELMMGSRAGGSAPGSQQQQQQAQQTGFTNGFGSFGGLNSNNAQEKSEMSSIASSFSSLKIGENKTGVAGLSSSSTPFGASPLSAQNTSTTASSSTFSSFLPNQTTGATVTSTTSSTPSISVSSPSLKPQMTGFSGIKPFKPSSSFGAHLLDSLPPIPQSAPTTPKNDNPPSLASPGSGIGTSSTPFSSNLTGFSSQPTGFGALSSQPTGAMGGSSFGNSGVTASTVGVGLRPQMTGTVGAANPFRASMFSTSSTPGNGLIGGGTPSFQTSMPTGGGFNNSGLGSSLFSQPMGAPTPSFGSSLFNSTNGASQSQSTQTQQSGSASLI
ncbi:ANTH-domain-containing protein [Neolentinus lepideus HHB14362 ss-1]|uniref:ANTH-domain-containing protein n=1 Tax=Neolentinus lepideus HHB14362 ss-1 TaxID=1314782 RepID=A0A165SIV4_9AGAM|nr:ANTH-domain-containing protein [Neolentinus lepideus HHB14362 ss-1]